MMGGRSPTLERTASDSSGGAAHLADRVVQGDRRAAARLITLIENESPGIENELREIVPHTGRAHIIGITGPAGSGKSTLVWKLAAELRSKGKRVGIIAVDPTSPFTGGAVLGDRVRMQGLASDPGVFIRSMASRGAMGGLARATADAAKVLDAFGCDVVLVETVGAGQDEVDIARMAHTTVVVQVPGMGDEIQAIKAGILEIGDVFAVNKADRVRSDMAVSELRMMLEMNPRMGGWMPPIIKTVATKGEGVAELAEAVASHWEYLRGSGGLAGRLEETAERELAEAARQRLYEALRAESGEAFDLMLRGIVERRIDPRSAARHLVAHFRRTPADQERELDSEGAA